MSCGFVWVIISRLRRGARFWVVFLAVSLLTLLPRAGQALSVKDYAEFVQINGVKPLDDGGFAVIGLLRSDAGPTRSGFLRLSASGEPLGTAVELPAPDGDYSGVVAMGLERLPSGDLVLCGWAAKEGGNANFWLMRLSPDGTVVWNHAWSTNALQQKFYEVKRLSSGKLLAVGRSQLGEKDKAAYGAALWIDADTGNEVKDEKTGKNMHRTYDCPDGALRCAFQDVAEVSDGSLVFAGWVTTKAKADDIWVLKTGVDGKPVKSATYGETGNDVAFSVASLGDRVLVAGTTRQEKDAQMVALARFDAALNKRTTISFPDPGKGQARAIEPLPYAKRFLIVGEMIEGLTSKGFAANLPADGTKAAIDDVAPQEASQFASITVDGEGNVVMGGGVGTGVNRRGLAGYRTESDLCPAGQNASTLVIDAPEGARQAGCAVASKPARLKLTGTKTDVVIVVRPEVGDIDAVIVRGETIVDASLNTQRASEILLLPADPRDLELSVAATTPMAVFALAVTTLAETSASEQEKAAETSSGEGADDESAAAGASDEASDDAAEDDTEAQDAAGEKNPQGDGVPSIDDARRLTDFALRSLGYDVPGEPVELDGSIRPFDRRAILAFQAAEGFPLTGELQENERLVLLRGAAMQIDALAQKAAATARKIAAVSPSQEFSGEDEKLESLAGGVAQDGSYAVGRYKSGAEFSGLWQGDLSDNPLPKLGVLQLTNDCTFAFGMANGFNASYDIGQPSFGTLGMIRHDGQIGFFGDFYNRPLSTECGGKG
jgi:hypothetical protein